MTLTISILSMPSICSLQFCFLYPFMSHSVRVLSGFISSLSTLISSVLFAKSQHDTTSKAGLYAAKTHN